MSEYDFETLYLFVSRDTANHLRKVWTTMLDMQSNVRSIVDGGRSRIPALLRRADYIFGVSGMLRDGDDLSKRLSSKLTDIHGMAYWFVCLVKDSENPPLDGQAEKIDVAARRLGEQLERAATLICDQEEMMRAILGAVKQWNKRGAKFPWKRNSNAK